MSAFTRLSTTSTLALLMSGSMLAAQVTAPQVWEDWQSTLAAGGAGALSTGAEDYAGGTLTVRDLSFTLSEDDTTITVTLPELVFTEEGDAVAITMSERMPISITAESDEGAPMVMALEGEQQGLAITATGTPEAVDYAIDVPLFALNLLSVDVEERDYDASGRFAVSAITGRYASAEDAGLIAVDYDIAAEASEFTFALTETDTAAKPAREIAFDVTGRITAPQSAATMRLPQGADLTDDAAALAAGFTLDGTQSAGATEITFHADDNGTLTEGRFTAAGTEATATAGGVDMAYGAAVSDMAFALSGSAMPFPLDVTAARAGVDVALPIGVAAEPSPFAFKFDLSEVALNEEVWAQFDPNQTIPRDPATLRVDLGGTARLVDGDDPAFAAAPAPAGKPGMSQQPAASDEEMALPAIIHSLDVNDVTLAFGGAEITAQGALAFDPAQWTPDSVPMPVGTISVGLKGLNGLAQKLSALGLIPADQVMMGMMMLGMFAVPTGDDEMTSEIGFTEEGGITANGQPVL